MGELRHLLPNMTGLQRDVIVHLFDNGGRSGSEIGDYLNEHYGDFEVKAGRLYPNLDKLVEMDLLDKGERDRRTNEYSLTARGAVMHGILASRHEE